MSSLEISKRKLVLHMDVNNTILIGDSVTEQISLEEILNEHIAEVAWGSVEENGSWKAHSNCLSSKPPGPHMISYYTFAEESFSSAGRLRADFKKHIRKFTEEVAGKPFRIHFEQMQERLKFRVENDQGGIDDVFSLKDSVGDVYQRIVPSFFELLHSLCESQRDFTVIFRTFGRDGEVVMKGTAQFFKGLHPSFPMPPYDCEVSVEPGTITRSNGAISLMVPNKVTTSDLRGIYNYFSESRGIRLFVDDYSWWKEQGFLHSAGKPLLLDLQDKTVQHIMFDDNIRIWDPDNSIVDVQTCSSDDKHTFLRADPGTFENMCVVKCDLYESICNKSYFIEKVQECEQRYQKFLGD